MGTKFSKAGSVRPFELAMRRLHISDLFQTYKAHLYGVYGIMYYEVRQCTFRRILGSFLSTLLKNERAFHLKVTGSHEKRITYVRVVL